MSPDDPVSHLASASRGLMHGGLVADDVGWIPLWRAALFLVFAPLTMRLYNAER